MTEESYTAERDRIVQEAMDNGGDEYADPLHALDADETLSMVEKTHDYEQEAEMMGSIRIDEDGCYWVVDGSYSIDGEVVFYYMRSLRGEREADETLPHESNNWATVEDIERTTTKGKVVEA